MSEELIRTIICDGCGMAVEDKMQAYIRKGWAIVNMDCFDGSDKAEELAFCSRKCLTDYFTRED